MDDTLRTRYAALVSWYEPTESFQAIIKPLVASAIGRSNLKFRPDAEYFLIVNCSEMILRPYGEPIPKPPIWWEPGERPSTLPVFRGLKPDTVVPMIEKALDIVIANVIASDEEVSSHEVLLAIDRGWKELAEMLWWG